MVKVNVKVIAAAVCLMLSACKTHERIVTVERVKTDTAYITREQRDSIWLHDSVYVHEYQRGDTIYVAVDKWHTKYIDRSRCDTIYRATHDTIPQPYPVEVEVERQLTWWQRLRIHLGNLALAAIAVVVGWGVIKLRVKS